MAIIVLPEVLKERLGEEGSKALVEVLNGVVESRIIDAIKSEIAERSERLKAEIYHDLGNFKAEIIKEVANRVEGLESKMYHELGNLRAEIYEKFEEMNIKIENVKVEMTERIESAKTEMAGRIESVKSEITERIERLRSDIIKWMFGFWIGQVIALAGLLFAFAQLVINLMSR